MDAGLVAKPPCCRVILDVVTASGSDACPVLTRGKQSSGDVSAASSGYARFVLYNRMLCQCNHCGGDGEITDLQCSARSLRSLLAALLAGPSLNKRALRRSRAADCQPLSRSSSLHAPGASSPRTNTETLSRLWYSRSLGRCLLPRSPSPFLL